MARGSQEARGSGDQEIREPGDPGNQEEWNDGILEKGERGGYMLSHS